jgi:hypothetical protein
VALNLTATEEVVDLREAGTSGRVALSTELDRDEPVELSRLRLRPNEGVIIVERR